MNMKSVTLGAMLVLLCGASTAALALALALALAQALPDLREASANTEESAARVPLGHYLKAHATGDGAFNRKAFHPTAKIMSFRDGKLNALTVGEFATRFNGKAAADEAQRKRRIQTLHMAGNAAAATIVLDYPTTTFTDYMALLKVDGEWKIVNKTFHAQPKSRIE